MQKLYRGLGQITLRFTAEEQNSCRSGKHLAVMFRKGVDVIKHLFPPGALDLRRGTYLLDMGYIVADQSVIQDIQPRLQIGRAIKGKHAPPRDLIGGDFAAHLVGRHLAGRVADTYPGTIVGAMPSEMAGTIAGRTGRHDDSEDGNTVAIQHFRHNTQRNIEQIGSPIHDLSLRVLYIRNSYKLIVFADAKKHDTPIAVAAIAGGAERPLQGVSESCLALSLIELRLSSQHLV